MTKFYFNLIKFFKGREFLRQYSTKKETLETLINKKTIAIIGNANSLINSSFGEEIEKNDIVIRLNDGKKPSNMSHGQRTDILAVSKKITKDQLTNICPKILIWMTPKIKRLSLEMANYSEFILYDKKYVDRLADKLGSRPSTGVMVIDMVEKLNPRIINLYGFDFFESKSMSGSREAKNVPHDFLNEKKYILKLISSRDNIFLRK